MSTTRTYLRGGSTFSSYYYCKRNLNLAIRWKEPSQYYILSNVPYDFSCVDAVLVFTALGYYFSRMSALFGLMVLCVVAGDGLGEDYQGSSSPEIEKLELAYFMNSEAFRDRGVLGLNVGSGLSLPVIALNTDIEGIAVPGKGKSSEDSPLVGVDVPGEKRRYFLQHDALEQFPLAPGSFDWIMSEHFIEHVPRDGAVAFFKEARRLLPEKGGFMRISTPDLDLYVKGYVDQYRKFFDVHIQAMTRGDVNKHLLGASGAALFNDLFRGYGHKYIYDFEELLAVADEAGVLVPRGDCVAEKTKFRVSSRNPLVAQLDDSLKAHETLYVDFVCGKK